MEDYSLSLALFDYLPVFASALGLFWLAGIIGSVSAASALPAKLGAGLVIAGGFCKATWKLIWVLTQNDLVWLANLLFILMAPGMILLAVHCFSAQRVWNQLDAPAHPNIIALLLIGLISTGAIVSVIGNEGSRVWFFIMLAGASVANITISGMMIRESFRRKQVVTAVIFLFSITLIISLSGLSRISEGSAPLQWLAEVLNLLAHGSFAIAIYRLRPHIPLNTSRV